MTIFTLSLLLGAIALQLFNQIKMNRQISRLESDRRFDRASISGLAMKLED